MLKVEKIDGGHLIGGKLLFGEGEYSKKYLNLATDKGVDMRYDKLPYSLIDYPGEYDMQGIIVNCFVGTGNKLNYVVSFDSKRIGIIQSPDVLNDNTIGNLDFWLYADEKVAALIDQMELEGEKVLLD